MRKSSIVRTGIALVAVLLFSMVFVGAVPASAAGRSGAADHGSVTITYRNIVKPVPLPDWEPETKSDTASEGFGATLTVGKDTYSALIAEAEKYLGTPYVWVGKTPRPGFDCSGYVAYVYKQAEVYNFNGANAQGIYNQCAKIGEKDAEPGDLVFFKNTFPTNDGRAITHVGIYLGNGKMLHSPGTGKSVCVSSFHTKYWQNHKPTFGQVYF